MALTFREEKGSALTYLEMDNNLRYLRNAVDISHSELLTLKGAGELVPGTFYLINDFYTAYDRPDYDIYRSKVSEPEYIKSAESSILVLAISENELAAEAWQPDYPRDKIKYDITYNTTEFGGTAVGRITERIDEFNNRTDYDHRVVEFKRYPIYTYSKEMPLTGEVQLLADGTVNGTDTNFTSLTADHIISIEGTSETYYKIVSITSNSLMTVTGSFISAGGPGLKYYSASQTGYISYYPNNISGSDDFELYPTFELGESDNVFNNYIGNHAIGFTKDGIGDFILSNNVFKGSTYQNNTFGPNSYNNTFEDDCTNNQIGSNFRNNITNDDFDGNVIGNGMELNFITANFQFNRIGENFESNIILNGSFYRNQIGNDFYDNWIDANSGNFQNNIIGNQFHNNELYDSFYKNKIGNGANNNIIWPEFYGNYIGNGFNNNSLYVNTFYENRIGEIFESNTIGDNLSIGSGDFFDNQIWNDFYGNSIEGQFFSNDIKAGFNSNTCDTFFRFNQIDYPVSSTIFSGGINVQNDYNCRIFRGSNSTLYLEYFDGTSMTYSTITS